MTVKPLSPLWVVKLGGSLDRAPELKPWLNVLAQVGAGRVVVVPGGGRFADAVREAQARWEFDDLAAHRMAVRAMEQYACMLAALEPRLVPAATLPVIRQVLADNKTALWQPAAMVLDDVPADVAADWHMSSDSLAAWMVGRLGTHRLALVKSVPPPEAPVRCDQVTAQGVVDARLRQFLVDHRIDACWLGPSDHTRFAELLAGTTRPLTPILA